MGKKDKKDKKSKSRSKNVTKKESPQVIQSVNFRGSDPSSYVAIMGEPSDTDDAIIVVPESLAGSSMPLPSSTPSNVQIANEKKEKKPKKEKKKKEKKVKEKKKKRDKKETDVEVTTENEETDVELIRKPSPVIAPLPRLTNEEYKFFMKVKSGDTEAVAAYLSSPAFQKISINKTDKRGYTVLHYAVRRQDEDMVRLLLQQPGIRLYDTLLHAIKEHNVEITKILLELYDKASSEDQKQRFMSTLGSGEDQSKALSMLVANTSGVFVPPQISPISARSGIKSSIKMNIRTGISSVRSGGSSKANSGIEIPSPTSAMEDTIPNVQAPTTSVQPQEGDDKDIDEMPFDPEFPPVITPLMLAAKEGFYPLISLFYSREERLETGEYTHNLGCGCDICVKLDGDQDMSRAYQRYHLFDALTDPVYICFMARAEKIDPVDYAICKILKLREIIKREWAYQKMFMEYETRLEVFISDLLAVCRNTKETEIFLSPKDSAGKERLPHAYPRLWYAVGLDLKYFVSQPNFQNLIYRLWVTDEWPEWDTHGKLYRIFLLLIRIPLFPIIFLYLLCFQDTRLGRLLACPLSKFLTYVASYIFFLGVVTVQVMLPFQRCNHEMPYYQIDDYHCKERGPPRIGTEWVLVVYVFSFYVSMIRRNSVSWYWSMTWNWYDLVTQLSFTITFICWLWAYLWTKMPENKDLLMATDRLMWPHDCAEIVGECFLAVSTFLASGRVLRFMAVHPTLGPMQISLGKQIVDFFTIILFMIVVIIAFASGMTGLYLPYKDFHGVDPKDGNKLKLQDNSFHTVLGSFKAFFFILYGHGNSDVPTLLTWMTKNGTANETGIHHYYTEKTGKFLFQAYNMIGVTLVFSMLSAYFTQTATMVLENVDAEWKYGRTELYLTFMKDSVLPPPFNFIPNIQSIARGLKWCSRVGHKHEPIAACSMKQCCFLTSNEKTNRWERMMEGYRKLILQLMYRYLTSHSEDWEEQKATKDDVVELGEELTEIKALLKKFKGEIAGPDEGGDDDDADVPPGGGIGGTVHSVASGKKGWSKPKFIVESAGSTYLQNTGRRGSGGSGGTTAGSQMSAKSAPIVSTQPSSKGMQSQVISVSPSSGLAAGTSEQINVLFTPIAGGPVPKPRSGSGQLTGGNFDSPSVQEVSTQQVYGVVVQPTATSASTNYSGISETPSGDFSQPRKGSRGGGGLEGAVGLEDFSGRGTVESAYRSSPTNGNNYMDMDPTPKKSAGLVDVTGISPPVAHQATKIASQKSPPQTSLNLNMTPSPTRVNLNMTPSPTRLSGVSVLAGASSPDQSLFTGKETRRNSSPFSPITGMASARISPIKSGLGSIETPQKPSTTNAFNYMDMDPSPKQPAGVVDVTGISPPVAHGLYYASGAGSQKSPPQTSLTLNTTPSPTRPSGISGLTGASSRDQSRKTSLETRRTSSPTSPITGMASAKISPKSTNQQFPFSSSPTPRRNSGLIDVWSVQDANSNKTNGLPPAPTRTMSPGTKLNLAEPESSQKTMPAVTQMKTNEFADISARDSPGAKVTTRRSPTTEQTSPNPSKMLYSPSNSPSMIPSTTGLPTNVRSIAMHTFSSESGNATDGSSKANYDSPSESSTVDPRPILSQPSTSPLAGGFKLKDPL